MGGIVEKDKNRRSGIGVGESLTGGATRNEWEAEGEDKQNVGENPRVFNKKRTSSN